MHRRIADSGYVINSYTTANTQCIWWKYDLVS